MQPATCGLWLGLMVLAAATPALADGYPVAGLTPSQRPAGAPVITKMAKDAQWYQRALAGVSTPYPASLRFLEDQGPWFTPFTRPGMTGPYDIRHWHAKQ